MTEHTIRIRMSRTMAYHYKDIADMCAARGWSGERDCRLAAAACARRATALHRHYRRPRPWQLRLKACLRGYRVEIGDFS